MSNIKWYGDKFLRDLKAEERRRLARAAMVVERYAKRLLGVSGTGWQKQIRGVVTVKKRGGKGKGWTVYGAFQSRPGEPPHKQTGELRRRVTHEVLASEGRARVGTNLKYGKWLETGTRTMAARPWLARSVTDNISELRAILGAFWKWNG
jgi:hypothetical protein